ncbi:MAG: CDP-alcohol phosphatidyltransferase family protein [Deltaproteobacteria bacterium]|nr:CDP-alcohol phosphatidyltransferase family protein [Deltaproteobacteria bacterium]
MNYNIPNILTYFRLAAIPFFLWAFLAQWYLVAFLLFLCAGGSDLIDGYIARRLNQRTKTGAILDPLADKLLMAVTYLLLATVHIIPWWFVILIFAKDLLIVGGLGILRLSKVEIRYAPVFWSKATTLFLILIGTMALLDLVVPGVAIGVYPLGDFVFGGIFITTGLIVITMLQYVSRGIELLQTRAPSSV